jgi:hypothetical protein
MHVSKSMSYASLLLRTPLLQSANSVPACTMTLLSFENDFAGVFGKTSLYVYAISVMIYDPEPWEKRDSLAHYSLLGENNSQYQTKQSASKRYA